MSKKRLAFAEGRVEGIRESGWHCGDCGNFYDATVDGCPNRLLDEALVNLYCQQKLPKRKTGVQERNTQQAPGNLFGYRSQQRTPDGKVIVVGPFDTREEAEQAAAGNPIVAMGAGEADRAPAHEDAQQEHLGGCPCAEGPCCQWMGECVCQCMCDFIASIEDRVRAEPASGSTTGGSLLRLGYEQALRDVAEKARLESEVAREIVESLVAKLSFGQD